ncbi:MAG TPA: TetR family transcriptional regulator [Herpetosiphonaceae bacterium]|nr:TetR family transcriptional regulator [Herpetosiphonaceae bacterium]
MKYQEDNTQIDEQILAAAAALLDDVGEAFTIGQLADRTQISRATLYRRVGNKEALLQRMAETRGSARGQQDSRSRILAAARQVFARNGLLGATMEQIAEEAGVGVATVYRQFGDKDQLVRAFADHSSPVGAVGDIVVHASADVRADLTELLGVIVPFFYDNRDLFRLVLAGSQAEMDYLERLRTGANRMRDRLVDYFAVQIGAGRLRDTARPEELALALIGMLISSIVIGPAKFELPLPPPERISALIIGILLDGALPSHAKGNDHAPIND